MERIITDIPPGFGLFCLLLGAVYAGALYIREYRHEFSALRRTGLGIFRFLVVSFISFLLLSPFIRSQSRSTEDPVIAFLQDNSKSVLVGRDSASFSEEYLSSLEVLVDELGKKYNMQYYTFGSESKKHPGFSEMGAALTFSNELTNISQAVQDIRDLYYNRNLGAVILASDGIYNSGLNPFYAGKNLGFPVYAIGLGDTNVRKDLLISGVRFNRLAYLDNKFPLEVTIISNKAEGEQSETGIFKNGSKVAGTKVSVNSNSYSETVSFILTADEPGLQQYDIRITPVEGEISTVNNYRSIFIDVLDSRNRILILSSAPHPDITAIREALRSNINYEVDAFLLDDFSGPLDQYNLVVLHQVPSQKNLAVDLLNEINDKNIPVLYIVGPATELVRWNGLNLGAEIQSAQKSRQEVLPELNASFPLFTLSEDLGRSIVGFPPLLAPFGDYVTSNNATTLLYQRIGSVNTSKPLVFFAEDLDRRWGAIMGSGIWRWRLSNYAGSGNHDAFNELMVKMAQYLSLKENRNRFRVYHEKDFLENEPLIFEAELYNKSFELVTGPEMEITFQNSEGDQFPYSFIKRGNSYYLEAGIFPPGKYTYLAKVNAGDTLLYESGALTVSGVDLEMLRTTADHNLLHNLSLSSGGQLYQTDEMDKLAADLLQSEEIRPVIYTQMRYLPLIDMYWLLIPVILLLSVEWFLRRRWGSY